MGMSVSADTTTGTSDVNNQTESTQSNTDSIQTDTTTLNSSNKSASSMQNTGATAAEQEDQNSATDNAIANQQANATALQTSLVAVPNTEAQKTLRGTQTEEVSDWQGFVNAMNNKNVGTINLTGDINVTNKANGTTRPNPVANPGKIQLTGSNISGGLDIDGQGHTINFGQHYLSFTTKNQKDSNPWNIAFKNLTIKADGYSSGTYTDAFSPIYMGGDDIDTKLLAQNKVTFENVNANIKHGGFYVTTMAQVTGDDPYTTVTFKGNNNITCEEIQAKQFISSQYNYSSAVMASHIIFANGNTTFNVSSAKTNNGTNAGGNILRAKIENSNDADSAVVVAEGATVNLNGKSTDVKGILTNSAITGDVVVDGTLNANMADGHSMAIWAGNLNIGKNGTVDITTSQNNDGGSTNATGDYNGFHFAPISLGVGFAQNLSNADSNTLTVDGKLIVKRVGNDNKSTSPLISFGSGASALQKGTYTLNVNDGATLDLQDAAQSSRAGKFNNTPFVGLISMFGGGTKGGKTSNALNISNPAYVNLQRTGSLTDSLLRLENINNSVSINGVDGSAVPVAQWDEANYTNTPSYYWYLKSTKTQNNWGDNAVSGFAPKNATSGTTNKDGQKLINSNGNVELAANQAGEGGYAYVNGEISEGTPTDGVKYQTPYLNQFLNTFNYWTPQRLAMGSNLEDVAKPTDAEKYQPTVKTINGTTKQTLADLTAKDGISGLMDQNGNTTDDLSPIQSVTWYDPSTDATDWANTMKDKDGNTLTAPTNPTGNLKTTDTSAWAKVTYTDGTVDFANIPLKVTNKTTADEYTPSYKPVNVEQGKSATSDPSFTDVNNKPAAAPAGTTFAKGTDAPDWATIDQSTGEVTVAPGTDVTPKDYSIPVTVTYSDGSTDTVNVPVTVTKKTPDADKYTPEGKPVSTEVGTLPDAKDGIKNPDTLPATYTWKEEPDVTTPGSKPATVVVTYPDGSKDEVHTNVIVDAKPEIKPITTTVNGTPAATDGIANLNNGGTTPVDGYPSGATWTTAPDTSKPGATTGTAEVTYPDGTKQTVTIPVAVNDDHDVTIIDDQGHTISLHANDVITHKTSETNVIGQPVVQSFKFSYYQGGQNYSKPYIYTLNAAKGVYELTQKGQNPEGVTVNVPESIPVSDIKVSWVPAGTTLFGDVKGNGQPTSVAGADNGGTETIKYTGNDNAQANGYPKYVAVVDSSSVNWPIFGKGPAAMNPFPSVYIYGAKANGTIPSVNSDTTDVKKDLGKAENYVDTSDLTVANNSAVSSVEWQTTPNLSKADAKAPATVRINFTDGSHLDIPVSVNVIKVDQGIDNKDDRDLYRDITRTITVEGQDQPVVQDVIYSRAKSTDLSKPAGSQVTYTDWVAAKDKDGNTVTNFPQLEVTKPGYTATATGATIETVNGKQYVPASATVTPDSQDETVNVTYTANEHTQVINYVDKDGNKVGDPYNVTGKTGETVTVDVPGHVPTNWTLVPGQKYASSVTFGSDNPQPLTYTVEHKTEVVPVDKNNKDTYREITQTIEKIPAGKTEADKTNVRTTTVTFQRTGTKNLVTNKITWNAWQGPKGSVDKDGKVTYTIPVYDVKQEKGYDSYVDGTKATQVPTEDVNVDSANTTFTITYVKQGSTPVNYDPARDDMSVTRTINYDVPAGHDAIAPVTQTVEYTRNVDGVAGYQDPVTGHITWNAWHVKSGNSEFASTSVEQIKGYDSYVNGTKTTEVPSAAVTEENGVPQNGTSVTVSYQKQDSTPVPYKPGKDGVNDNMNKYVTRTITAHIPKSDPQTQVQIVKFTREDKDGNAGYQDPVTGDITWNAWHVVNGTEGTGTWSEYTAPVVDGYKASQDSVAAQTVTPETKNANVDITYTQTDAGKYTPQGQDVTTKVGVVPDAEKGISNTKTLPEGTTYTWKETPDVTTAGDKPATVVVTYPDGSKDEVPVTVHVTNPSTPTNPTDADKYTPKGQDITTKVGEVPGAEKGISNTSDLPKGTTYTWKETPDVTTPGDKPATVVVTYPDGSKDEVPVTVHVTNPTTPTNPTDADKYTPQGQDVNTKTGVVPDPAEGIKNKGDLPNGTKYTWKETPDVTTPGDKPATVVVTYPDGSKDEVPVTVHVTNPTTPTNPTDADKNTPQGQDIHTNTGVVPNPADGIKNKGDLPDGTKYTWKETPDVTTPGEVTGIIVVTYPDGSKDEVSVTIIVTNPTEPTNNGNSTPQGQNTQNTTVVTNGVNGVSTTSENNTKKANTLPQTGNKQNSAAIAGLALTGFAAMFGLGGSKKKEK